MDAKDIRNLSEAYMEVYASPEELDEASSRDEFTRAAIARSSGRKGGITFEPGPNWDPSANRGKGAHLSPKQKEKQRRKALRQNEQVDIYDIILSHLLDEGYAETPEAAERIMVNMSEEWREDIVEMAQREKLPVGKMLKQAAKHTDPERVAKMAKVADTHNPAQAKRKEDKNRETGGRKRDAGRPRSNELQDNW
jgi:hypothetical protein